MFNNRDNFFLSSNLDIFHMLLALAKTYMTMLNRSAESKHPCFVPDIREKYSVFNHFKYDVSCIFFVNVSYWVEEGPF